ncbi:CREB-binding protein-like isoform X2 [Dreissena polymorpha]|uniref:CREB-binding protein-like isoform X2 n=1 Tax=Dreissena polymorpha TaxID=45954 RepID=UPI002264D273|nr:CREB-binding protein-like isoform X2 [Dreissena polymorpha]
MTTIAHDWQSVQRDVAEKLKTKPADEVKKKIVIPDPVPVGNHLAHFIRSIHWNSKGMLPSTAGSQRSYDKYNTVTHLSFQGPEHFYIAPGEAAGGFERKKEKIEDIMLTPRNQIFNRWKVPERIVNTPAPSTPSIKPETPAQMVPDVKVHTPSVAMTPPASALPEQPIVPAASAKLESRKSVTRISREMSLPNIKLNSMPVQRSESRNGLQQSLPATPRSAAVQPRSPPVASPRRAKTMYVDTRKKTPPTVDLNGITNALRPEALPQAEEWLKTANSADKRVIERVLKMAGRKQAIEKSLKKTLLPDAKDTVEKWMKDASENERQVALNFFSSLAGSQLMGMTVDSQRKRLKEVINTLEDASPNGPYNGYVKATNRRKKQTISDGNLRYVRLLTPDTRKNSWMHTTWHHLPEYRDDDPVNNWSSHYIRPHAQIPRHFVIHPDWG